MAPLEIHSRHDSVVSSGLKLLSNERSGAKDLISFPQSLRRWKSVLLFHKAKGHMMGTTVATSPPVKQIQNLMSPAAHLSTMSLFIQYSCVSSLAVFNSLQGQALVHMGMMAAWSISRPRSKGPCRVTGGRWWLPAQRLYTSIISIIGH